MLISSQFGLWPKVRPKSEIIWEDLNMKSEKASSVLKSWNKTSQLLKWLFFSNFNSSWHYFSIFLPPVYDTHNNKVMMTTLHDALHVRDAPELRHIGKALFCQNSFAVVKTITFVWCSFVVIRDLFEKTNFSTLEHSKSTKDFRIWNIFFYISKL